MKVRDLLNPNIVYEATPYPKGWLSQAILSAAEEDMPSKQVMKKFAKGKLRSGSKKGRKVTDPRQAYAIMKSEERKEKQGKKP
jgi:hypothetical protein